MITQPETRSATRNQKEIVLPMKKPTVVVIRMLLMGVVAFTVFRFCNKGVEGSSTAGGSFAGATPISLKNEDVGANGAAVRGGAKVHFIGGRKGAQGFCSDNVMGFDIGSRAWTDEAPMPTARKNLTVVRGKDGLIYGIGGDDCFGHVLTTVEAYDENADSWSVNFAPLPMERTEAAAVAADNGNIYVIGGRDQQGHVLNSVLVYDGTSWADGPLLRSGRSALGATLSPNSDVIYACGGYNLAGTDQADCEKLDLTAPNPQWVEDTTMNSPAAASGFSRSTTAASSPWAGVRTAPI